jgi:hypothetical protein
MNGPWICCLWLLNLYHKHKRDTKVLILDEYLINMICFYMFFKGGNFYLQIRDYGPKFATGLKCLKRHRSKNIWVTRLFFCQNDTLMGESLWQKDTWSLLYFLNYRDSSDSTVFGEILHRVNRGRFYCIKSKMGKAIFKSPLFWLFEGD